MFDPSKGTRTGPAWLDLRERLKGAPWRTWADVVQPVADAHGLTEKTISNMLFEGVKAGKIERRTVSTKPNRYEFRIREEA